MKGRPKSEIVDYLAEQGKPVATKNIAEALGINPTTACTRVKQLEQSGLIKRVNQCLKTRDVRWVPDDSAKPQIVISYRGIENLEAMQAVMRSRLLAGLHAEHVEEAA
jgi:predicted transcriptional regulator